MFNRDRSIGFMSGGAIAAVCFGLWLYLDAREAPATPQDIAACSDIDVALARGGLEQKFSKTKFDSVKCADISGPLFEVVTGPTVSYVNKDLNRLVIGKLFDMSTADFKLLSPEVAGPGGAKRPVAKVEWSEFPAGAAVVSGKGGKYKVAVFSDLSCPHCQRLHFALKAMPDVEVHEYVASILQGSRMKAESALCNQDKVKGVQMAYLGSDLPASGAGCADAASIDAVNAFMSKKGWNGTPVIVSEDGRVMSGFRSPEALRQFLEQK